MNEFSQSRLRVHVFWQLRNQLKRNNLQRKSHNHMNIRAHRLRSGPGDHFVCRDADDAELKEWIQRFLTESKRGEWRWLAVLESDFG